MIGFSVTDVVKAATDPRAQRLVAAASQAYAPEQTARITAATQQALTNYRQAKAILRTPVRGRPVPMMPMPDDDSPASMVTPGAAPAAQRGNILLFGAIGAALLLVLLMRK